MKSLTQIGSFLAIMLGLLASAFAAPGDLDTTFSADGMDIAFNGIMDSSAQGVAVQTDGRIVVAGKSNGAFALVRYNGDGSVDNGFGVSGMVTTPILADGMASANAVAIQTDGKIVAAGFAGPLAGTKDIAVVRYNSDGTLDSTFDGDGIVTTNLGSSDSFADGLALQGDGKILVAGHATVQSEDFAVVRYNTDGSLDLSFDLDGIALTDLGGSDNARDIAVDGDQIVVGGYAMNGSGNDFAVAIYNTADGSLKTSQLIDFGVPGQTSDDVAYGLDIDSGGRIVLAGQTYTNNTSASFAVARLTRAGVLEADFGTNGKLILPMHSKSDNFGFDVAFQPNGKILVAGLSPNELDPSTGGDLALVRLTSVGALDNSFGTAGKVFTSFSTHYSDSAEAVVLQKSDGKIVAAGALGTGDGFVVARYLGDSIASTPSKPKPTTPSSPSPCGNGTTDCAGDNTAAGENEVKTSENPSDNEPTASSGEMGFIKGGGCGCQFGGGESSTNDRNSMASLLLMSLPLILLRVITKKWYVGS